MSIQLVYKSLKIHKICKRNDTMVSFIYLQFAVGYFRLYQTWHPLHHVFTIESGCKYSVELTLPFYKPLQKTRLRIIHPILVTAVFPILVHMLQESILDQYHSKQWYISKVYWLIVIILVVYGYFHISYLTRYSFLYNVNCLSLH